MILFLIPTSKKINLSKFTRLHSIEKKSMKYNGQQESQTVKPRAANNKIITCDLQYELHERISSTLINRKKYVKSVLIYCTHARDCSLLRCDITASSC